MQQIKLLPSKIIQFTKKLLASFILFTFWGCPPQRAEILCALDVKNPIKQNYVTGIESGRGEIYKITLVHECKDSLTIDSVKLDGALQDFRVFRNENQTNKGYPKDSLEIVINRYIPNAKKSEPKTHPKKRKVSYYYTANKNSNSFTVSEFKKGEPILTR